MGNIRKQTIVSSLLIYLGFFIGAINTYLYTTKVGAFTPGQFALTRLFFDIGQNFYIFGSLGLVPIFQKFFPYYKDNLKEDDNDLFTWIFTLSLIGFLIVTIIGFFAEPLVVRKFTEKSRLVVDYYYYIIVFAFGMLLFALFEGLAWANLKTVMPNFLKETALRLVTSIFIVLFYLQIISFHGFMQLFTSLYFIIAICLVFYLKSIHKLHFNFNISRVTKKIFRKMLQMQSLIFGGMIILALGQTMDSIFIASMKGIGFAGVYALAQYGANLIQVPQRSMQSIVTGILSQAWKDKNYPEINRVYQRSSINMLLMSLFIFGFIMLNIKELFAIMKVQDDFTSAIALFAVIGLVRIVDAGTGVNGIIIATSTFWRFDFISGIIMLGVRIPLTYFLIKKFGTIGAAYSELIGMTLYNFIRWQFLKSKFNMQPLTFKTLYSLLVFAAIFLACNFLFYSVDGWLSIFLKSIFFTILFIIAVFAFSLTPDAKQLYDKWKQKRG